MSEEPTLDPAVSTPAAFLRRAAAADAAHARELLCRISTTRLLDLVVTQAELAVDDGDDRPAGIDAIGDLARAAVEVMELSQDLELDLDDDPLDPPTVTGWELTTVSPEELLPATLALPVRPWMLALVAFGDAPGAAGTTIRHVVAAAADGRLAMARLRLLDVDEDAEILAASVVRDPVELGDDAPLAQALHAALASAARGD